MKSGIAAGCILALAISCAIDLPLVGCYLALAVTSALHLSSPCFDHNWFAPMFKYVERRDAVQFQDPKRMSRRDTPQVTYDAKTYKIDDFVRSSEGWTLPAVIKGMYPDLERTLNISFLYQMLGDMQANVINTEAHGYDEYAVNCLKKDRLHDTLNIKYAIDQIVDHNVSMTLIMPGLARAAQQNMLFKETLAKVFSTVDVTKLGGKFAESEFTTWGKQFWLSRANSSVLNESTTWFPGTGMHADCCNSITIQVAGRKRWNSFHTNTSHLWMPALKWAMPVAYGHIDNKELLDQVDRMVNTMEPGDVMFMPEWYWHFVEIIDHEPAISMTFRDCVWRRNFRSLPMSVFTFQTIWSTLWTLPERGLQVFYHAMGANKDYADGFWHAGKN